MSGRRARCGLGVRGGREVVIARQAPSKGSTTRSGGRRAAASALAVADSQQLAWALIALGAALRIAQYASGRSLWLDEVYVALNVMQRSYQGLLQTLNYQVGAPPAFLLGTKLAVAALGSGEAAFRLLPLVAGLLSLPLFHRLARAACPPWAANLALAFYAVSGGLIRYASEVKPYELDAFVTIALVYAATIFWRRGARPREAVMLGAVGLVGVCFSYPAVFVLGAVLVAAAAEVALRRDRLRASGIVTLAASLLVPFAIVWFAFVPNIRGLQQNVFGYYYLPLPPTSGPDLHRLADAFSGELTGDVGLGLPRVVAVVAAVLILVGAVYFARCARFIFLICVSLLVIVIVASAADRYPWGGRFTLFLVPLLILFAAAGIAQVGAVGGAAVVGAVTLAVVVLAIPTERSAKRLVHPQMIEETRPLLQDLAARWRSGDTLYVSAGAQYAFRYYSQYRKLDARPGGTAQKLWPLIPGPGGRSATAPALRSAPPHLTIGRVEDQPAPRLVAAVLKLVQRRPRVWVLLSHLPRSELDELPQPLGRARTAQEFRRHGAALYLYTRR